MPWRGGGTDRRRDGKSRLRSTPVFGGLLARKKHVCFPVGSVGISTFFGMKLNAASSCMVCSVLNPPVPTRNFPHETDLEQRAANRFDHFPWSSSSLDHPPVRWLFDESKQFGPICPSELPDKTALQKAKVAQETVRELMNTCFPFFIVKFSCI